MKVLHVLANSPPDVNGYAIRTQKILSNQTNELVGLTSPWYPNRESMIDDYEIDGDFVESQAFAFLAVRSILSLPITFPNTTGCKKPCVGGELIKS